MAGGLSSEAESVVPIVVGWAQAVNGRMTGDHGPSHGISSGVSIETAIDPRAGGKEVG